MVKYMNPQVHVAVRECNEEWSFAVVLFRTYDAEDLTEKELLEKVQAAVKDWVDNYDQGRNFDTGDGVFDVVNLPKALEYLTFQECLRKQGLHDMSVRFYRDYLSEEWSYDTPLYP